jgi:hypothetical protein
VGAAHGQPLVLDRVSLLSQLEQGRGTATADGVRALMSAPGVAANPAIAQHFGQLIEYQSALDVLTIGEWRRSETHPDVQRLRARMASTEARLVNAVRGQVATLGTRVAALDQMRARSGAEISQLPQDPDSATQQFAGYYYDYSYSEKG